jgi:predicted DNA-binding transcriptional regulator YafY
MNALAPSFNLAKARLGQLQKHNLNNSKNWLNKIRIIQPTQTLMAPQIDEGVQEIIYHALMAERRILALYQSIGTPEPKEYELNPQGLLVRGDVYYVVASVKENSTVALYALHRFKKAEVLAKKMTVPEGFNIDNAIKNGLGDFGGAQENIKLKIRCDKELIAYLQETPLSQDQLITTVDDQCTLTASVNNTWQLMWWLMSKGSALEVCEPESLRLQIKHEYQQGLQQYL